MLPAIQAVGGLTQLPAEPPRPPRPTSQPVAVEVGQLVGLGVPVRPTRVPPERLPLFVPFPTLLRHMGFLEVFGQRAESSVDIIASEVLRIQVYERIKFREEVFVHPVRELTSPTPGGEAARTVEVLPYVNFIPSLIEQSQIYAARRMLNAVPSSLVDDPQVARLRKALAQPVVRVSEKRDTNRSREYQWIREHRQAYRGQWVALAEGGLLTGAPSLRQLLDQLRTLRPARPPLVHHIE
jgi:hypothetical protein